MLFIALSVLSVSTHVKQALPTFASWLPVKIRAGGEGGLRTRSPSPHHESPALKVMGRGLNSTDYNFVPVSIIIPYINQIC